MESGYDENRRRIIGSVWRYDRGYRGRYTRYKSYWNAIKDGPLQNFYSTHFTSRMLVLGGVMQVVSLKILLKKSATDCYNFAVWNHKNS